MLSYLTLLANLHMQVTQVLEQEVDDEGHERVIAHGSHMLTKAECNYCVTRREQLPVVVFTSQFHSYLLHTDRGSLI